MRTPTPESSGLPGVALSLVIWICTTKKDINTIKGWYKLRVGHGCQRKHAVQCNPHCNFKVVQINILKSKARAKRERTALVLERSKFYIPSAMMHCGDSLPDPLPLLLPLNLFSLPSCLLQCTQMSFVVDNSRQPCCLPQPEQNGYKWCTRGLSASPSHPLTTRASPRHSPQVKFRNVLCDFHTKGSGS